MGVDGLAISSLPVPLSPWISTVDRLGATCATRSKTFSMDSLLPTILGEVVALLEGALELQILFFGAMPGHGGADVGQQLLVVPRLLDKVLRPGADGFHNVIHRAISRNHDDRQLGLALPDLGQQLQAALARQCQVQQYQIEVLLLQCLQTLFAVDGHRDRVAFERKQHFQRLADSRFVVDHKNADAAGDAVCCGCGDRLVQGSSTSGMDRIPQ